MGAAVAHEENIRQRRERPRTGKKKERKAADEFSTSTQSQPSSKVLVLYKKI